MYTRSFLWCILIIEALTVIVSFDCANEAEELNHPTEALLHLKHKHTRQDLKHKHMIYRNKQFSFFYSCMHVWSILQTP